MLRATLKSLLARKLRLVLSTIAVVLSVTFISASFVLSDTLGRSFDALFANVYSYTDIEVSKPTSNNAGGPSVQTFPESTVDRVEQVAGVSDATGQVFTNGAQVIGKNGKLVPNQSGQRFGANWVGENELINLSEGSDPSGDRDVVINKGLATAAGFGIGDTITVRTPIERRQFTVSGVFQYAGGRDSLGGEHTVFFTTPVAQEIMFGEPGVFNIIDVKVDDGQSLTKVRDDLRAALGPDFQVDTGPELAKKAAEPLKGFFNAISYVLVGFGAVALLVGVFLILNTFSIIVAQRTQELALLRAMGASRGQVMGSVLLEASVVGAVGSAIGFALGVGLGGLGAWGLGRLGGGGIEVAGLGVPLIAPIVAFGVGISVTVAAAFIPALKAARVAPIAAMREAAAVDRPLTKLTVTGAVITALAGGALAWGLTGAGGATIWLIFGGVLGLMIGVALLTPLISRPVVSLIGRIFAWSVPGQLGRRNSARNPRRTAITAAAVMIGIVIMTAISTVLTSMQDTIDEQLNKEITADVLVSGQSFSEIPPILEDSELRALKDMDGSDGVLAIAYDFARINGEDNFVFAYDDLSVAGRVTGLRAVSGSASSLSSGEAMLDEITAKNMKLKLGDTVRLQLPKGGERTIRLTAITAESFANAGFLISWDDAMAGFRYPKANQAALKADSGTTAIQLKQRANEILTNNPDMTAQTRDEVIGGQGDFFNAILWVIQILLLVAIVISVLGVVNTLLLSVYERTRELGVLRAIGLRRSQTARMVTVESMVIALFGTILGLGLGVGIGAAVVRALREVIGFGDLSLPWMLMFVYLVAAVVIGAFAAILPAIRAARLNVLNAIAYE
jgi:putative ABC transport system permease protein